MRRYRDLFLPGEEKWLEYVFLFRNILINLLIICNRVIRIGRARHTDEDAG